MTDTLGDALPRECSRVREIIGQYREVQALCPQANCRPAIALMEAALRAADAAMISGDAVAMLAAYNNLKEFEA